MGNEAPGADDDAALPWFLWDEPVAWTAGTSEGPGVIRLDWVQKAANSLPANVSDEPLTVAVFGPWGSGKTTILNRFAGAFGDQNTVRFDPWRYERETDLMIPLLAEMTAALAEHAADRARKDIIETGKALLGRAAKFAARAGIQWATAASGAGTLIAAMGGDPAKVGDAVVGTFMDVSGGWGAGGKSYASETSAFRKDFRKMIESSTRVSKPVRILIDDLDRCSHVQVLRLLEAIKNFLWEPGVIYILALDREQVTHAIAESLKARFDGSKNASLDTRIHARRYLEKFFVHSIDIEHSFPGYEREVAYMRSGMMTHLQDIPELAPLADWELVASVFGHCPPNLRKIKRIARWLYFEAMHGAHTPETFSPAFAEFVLAELHTELWLAEFSHQSISLRQRSYGFANEALTALLGGKETELDAKRVNMALDVLRRMKDVGTFSTLHSSREFEQLIPAIKRVAGSPTGNYLFKLLEQDETKQVIGLKNLVQRTMALKRIFQPPA